MCIKLYNQLVTFILFTTSKREARAFIYEGHKYVTIGEDRVTGVWRDVERVETANGSNYQNG